MELKSKKTNSYLKDAPVSLRGVFKDLVFNAALRNVLDYVGSIVGASNPIVYMHIERKMFSYEVSFDVLYKKEGQVMQQQRFYVVDLSGNDIPAYLIDEVRKNKTAEVKFGFEDLQIFYEEKEIGVDEASTFDELLNTCKDNGVSSIQLIDRVFYTRVLCFDGSNSEIGILHIGILKKVPFDVAEKLYPMGTVAYSVA